MIHCSLQNRYELGKPVDKGDQKCVAYSECRITHNHVSGWAEKACKQCADHLTVKNEQSPWRLPQFNLQPSEATGQGHNPDSSLGNIHTLFLSQEFFLILRRSFHEFTFSLAHSSSISPYSSQMWDDKLEATTSVTLVTADFPTPYSFANSS